MSQLTIIRGLPGSGKSTLGRRLAMSWGVLFLEPDALLVRNWNYCYSETGYQEAVQAVRRIVRLAGARRCDLVYADVLPTRADVRSVIDAYGLEDGDEYKVLTLAISAQQSRDQNTHHVSPDDLARMERTWEAWPGETVLAGDRKEQA